MEAYIASWRVSDLATAAPTKDWSEKISNTMTDPFKKQFLDGVEWLAKRGHHTAGHVSVSGTLVKATADSAVIDSCVDTSHQNTLDSTGRSIVAANGPGAYWRYVETAHMKKIGSHWKLASVEDQRGTTC